MKTTIQLVRVAAAVAVLGATQFARAALYNFSSSDGGHYTVSAGGSVPLGQVIPDNDPSGVAYPLNFAATGLHLADISITFTTAGGWNGDLYAYLSHGDGFAVLLNRVGASSGDADGYSTSGFTSITLALSAATDIHGVLSPTTEGGPYAADGRLAYTDSARDHTLGAFSTLDPNGSWTLFFADRAAGSTATLNSWSLDIATAVPEPVNVALALFAGVWLSVAVARRGMMNDE